MLDDFDTGAGACTRLRDGTPIQIRSLSPEDAGLLQNGFEKLSPASRLLRFLRPVSSLSPADIHGLSHPDHDCHEAICALDRTSHHPEAAGVAQYFRIGHDTGMAEFSLTVLDAYQARGLGTLLLGSLARLGSRRGITRFMALVHRENAPMIRLLGDLEATPASIQQGAREFVMPVHHDPAIYPETPAGAAFRQAYALWDGA